MTTPESTLRFMEAMAAHPALRAVALAPTDEEPLTEPELQGIAEAEALRQAGAEAGIPMEAVLAEFGLRIEDFPVRR